jgi:hypothetical protein
MIIRNLENTTGTKRARISATVEWENCHYQDREVFFETDACFADSLSPDPNAFLLAAIIPAMHFGERRIMVEGQLCPQLRDGLDIVVRQLRKWYGGEGDYIRVEASEGFNPTPGTIRAPRRLLYVRRSGFTGGLQTQPHQHATGSSLGA